MVCEEGGVGRPLVSKGLDEVHSGHSFRGQKLVVAVGKADPRGHCCRAEAGSKEPQWDEEDLMLAECPPPPSVFQSAQPITLFHG